MFYKELYFCNFLIIESYVFVKCTQIPNIFAFEIDSKNCKKLKCIGVVTDE